MKVPENVFQCLAEARRYFFTASQMEETAKEYSIGNCRLLPSPPRYETERQKMHTLTRALELNELWKMYQQYLYFVRSCITTKYLTRKDIDLKNDAQVQRCKFVSRVETMAKSLFQCSSNLGCNRLSELEENAEALAAYARRAGGCLKFVDPPTSTREFMESQRPNYDEIKSHLTLWRIYFKYLKNTEHHLFANNWLGCSRSLKAMASKIERACDEIEALTHYEEKFSRDKPCVCFYCNMSIENK